MNCSFRLGLLVGAWLWVSGGSAWTAEFHVSINGNDAQPGTRRAPFRTIQHAADLAQPGDVITVHSGVYRERVNPPRGGTSDQRRITYQAARGEQVTITGAEIVTNWTQVQPDVWQAILPNTYFGKFNPYADLIRGDWFDPRGREHHTGAVYLNGEWLTEAAKLEEVLMPPGAHPDWLKAAEGDYLVNLAWLRLDGGARVASAAFAEQQGTQKAACTEGGECLGWIDDGDWARYDDIRSVPAGATLELRVASATRGGRIEVRRDSPSGELLGAGTVANTGGWQDWITVPVKLKPAASLRGLCLVFRAASVAPIRDRDLNPRLWFARVDGANTTIWAQFPGVNPNRERVEVNVRQTVFYPAQPGCNYITLRGFTLSQAATPWAPPTAEQIGLVGTHWSRGWIIERNTVRHSVCSGIALGKHGDEFDNTSANTAEGYVKTIERAHARGWTRENIGHHVVRDNTISHCEQAGIVGSLGAAFSTVTGNTIHHVHVRRLFSGAEMAGIKFHAAIDCVIRNNHIYRTCLGLWLDWMAQGTRVSGNLFHDNSGQDLFVEVDHGPFVVDNNFFLSPVSLLDVSEGGAYAHNLFCGRLITSPEPNRETPFHPPHSTTVAGLVQVKGGDDRFLNNIFLGPVETGSGETAPAPAKDPGWGGGYGLWVYDRREAPLWTGGNVYFGGARPYARETGMVRRINEDPRVQLTGRKGRWFLTATFGQALKQAQTELVTTERLGRARIPNLPYEQADGAPISIGSDYLGKRRHPDRPTPGPVESMPSGGRELRVW